MHINKIFLLVLCIFLLVNMVEAQERIYSINPVKTGNCLTLIQYCDNCTYVNFTSITYPNGTVKNLNYLSSKVSSDTYINNSFCDTTLKGNYIYSTIGNPDGELKGQTVSVLISPSGDAYSSAQSSTYIIMLLLIAAIFILSLYGGIKLPGGNWLGPDGYIDSINWLKYLKYACYFVAYVCVVAISYFSWNITYAYLNFDSLSNFFRVIYTILMTLTYPVLMIAFISLLVSLFKDNKLNEALQRGLHIV